MGCRVPDVVLEFRGLRRASEFRGSGLGFRVQVPVRAFE
jgi:hypothetical protein